MQPSFEEGAMNPDNATTSGEPSAASLTSAGWNSMSSPVEIFGMTLILL
jgi:hypothetical protein